MSEQKEFGPETTFGEKYGPIVNIKTKEEAAAWFEKCVEHNMRCFDKTREESERIERSNIGYWSGYLSEEDAARVKELFNTVHPIFGY